MICKIRHNKVYEDEQEDCINLDCLSSNIHKDSKYPSEEDFT